MRGQRTDSFFNLGLLALGDVLLPSLLLFLEQLTHAVVHFLQASDELPASADFFDRHRERLDYVLTEIDTVTFLCCCRQLLLYFFQLSFDAFHNRLELIAGAVDFLEEGFVEALLLVERDKYLGEGVDSLEDGGATLRILPLLGDDVDERLQLSSVLLFWAAQVALNSLHQQLVPVAGRLADRIDFGLHTVDTCARFDALVGVGFDLRAHVLALLVHAIGLVPSRHRLNFPVN